LSIPEEKLESMYNLLKDTRFKLPDDIKIQVISIGFTDEKGIINDDLKSKARVKIEEAKKRIDNGEPFEEVALDYNPKSGVLEYVFFASRTFG